jgi:serine/threonine-protein kinase HipA
MISKRRARQIPDDASDEAYVWIWLPGSTSPVVAGLLRKDNGQYVFNYGQNYLARRDAIAIYEPELPLQSGELPLTEGLSMPSCLRDASPDAWGRRVIMNRKFGLKRDAINVDQLDELAYMLESGSDRIGALDFQTSPTHYKPREKPAASLEELLDAANRVEAGVPLDPELDQALFHGSSIGGARPKAMIEDQGKKYIAKFSSLGDITNVVKAEFIAMRMAAEIGLTVAPVELHNTAGKDVLLIERFDRSHTAQGWTRKAMVSALTLLGLDELMARYASYERLAEIIRHRFEQPTATLRELFGRLVFNILCGNTDDHARNHAAFWNGRSLSLTPAYDICPQSRSGNEATQAMLIDGGMRSSQLQVCLKAAAKFQLKETQAAEIMAHQVAVIKDKWASLCDIAGLGEVDRNALWQRQFLNPFAFEGLPEKLAKLAEES